VPSIRNASPKPKGGKRGAWREAKGPPEVGFGFKGVGRKVKNGFQSWQNAVKEEQKEKVKPAKQNVQNGKLSPSAADTASLKALLGVKHISLKANTDAANIASLPAVTQPKEESAPLAAPSAAPSNAADTLFQMMVQGTANVPRYSAPMPPQPPAQNAFNFTYVKKGEQHPSPPAMYQQMYPPHPPVPNGFPSDMPNMMPPMNMMGPMTMPPMGMMGPMTVPHMESAPIPVNRDKKTKEDGPSILVPAAFAMKTKK